MNIIFHGFVHPFIGIISGILIVLGSEFVGKIFIKKLYKNFFFLNLVFGIIIISLVTYIFIIIGISKYLNQLISYTLIFFGIINLNNLANILKFSKKNNLEFFILFIFLFLFFILSVTAPTMADALDYHLGVAKFVNLKNNFPNPNMWLHSTLYGLGEVYISIGLNVYSDTLGSIVQFFALASFLDFFSKEINNEKKFFIFFIFILSSPVLIFLLSGAKFQILPQLISTFVLYFLVKEEKIKYNLFIVLLFLILGNTAFKLSFFISSFVLTIFLLTKIKIELRFIITGFIIFSIIFLPKVLYNLINADQINFLSIFTLAPKEFLESLKNFRENNIFFPLNLFIPDSFGKLSTILGFQIVVLFFIKNIKKEIILIFFVVLVTSIIYFSISQGIARIYYEMLLWLSLSLIFVRNYKINLKYINFLLLINAAIVVSILSFGIFNLAPSLFSNDYRQNIMSKYAHEFKGVEWVNSNLKDDGLILTNLRSTTLLVNDFIPMDYTQYKLKKENLDQYYNFLRRQNIKYLVLKNYNQKNNYFFNKCKLVIKKQSPNFQIETRNIFNKSSFYNVTILRFKHKNFSDCF